MKEKKEVKNLRKKQTKDFFYSELIPKYYAKDLMVKPVLLLKTDKSETILKKLKKDEVTECIVVDEKGKFFGEINVEDIIKLFLKQVKNEPLVKNLNVGYRREFLYLTAKDLVNKQKTTVKINTPINKVIELLSKEKGSYLPVIDENKKVIGVITPSSVINFLKEK